MTDVRMHDKQIRQFLKLAREIQELNIVDGFENKTLNEIREALIQRSSPGTGYKVAYPRHGTCWEEEEKQQLIALTEAGMLNVDQFVEDYQRRPESVLKYMKKIKLLKEDYTES
ncbi:hypothetical protein [Klebsiella aerogenes]|uniref:hypothetical protein n=1 Tax=Klebsiella aerogenes TaxID=548 RepID=UPI003D322826